MATAVAEVAAVQKQTTPWVALTTCALILFVVANALSRPRDTPGHLRVFGTFWSSGWNLTHGHNPYVAGPMSWHPTPDHTLVDVDTYPPVILPLFAWLSNANPDAAYRIWDWLSALAFLLCAILSRGCWYQVLWFALCCPVIDSLLTAQIYPFLALFFVAAWLLLKASRQVEAGILIGLLVLLKPNFELWPIFLLFTAYRRAAIWSLLSGAFFAVVPVFFYGPKVYREWFVSLFHLSGDRHYIFPTNVSVVAMAQSLGHPNVGRVIACAMIVASFYFVARKRPNLLTASGLALTLGILASPVGWIHYTVFLVPVIFSFRWGWKLSCAMLLLLFPAWIACGVVMNHSPEAALLMRCIYMLPIAVLWGVFAHRQINSAATY